MLGPYGSRPPAARGGQVDRSDQFPDPFPNLTGQNNVLQRDIRFLHIRKYRSGHVNDPLRWGDEHGKQWFARPALSRLYENVPGLEGFFHAGLRFVEQMSAKNFPGQRYIPLMVDF